MKRIYFVILFLTIALTSQVFSQSQIDPNQYNAKEISAIIKMVEQELDGFRKSKANDVAQKEIDAIEQGITRAKSKLSENKLEEAHYTIEIAKALFAKIEARMELYYSEQVYSSTKKRLNQ